MGRMKTMQHVLFLLPVFLLSSCFTNRIAYKQMESIRRGMSAEEVIAILGEPSYRSFNDKGEMLEFREAEYGTSKVVKVWFVDEKAVEMKSYLDRYDNGCTDRKKAGEDDEKEGEKKSSGKSGKAKVRVTTDGKHVLQTGSIIVTPDGKHETVVMDAGGVIITASGKHIHVVP